MRRCEHCDGPRPDDSVYRQKTGREPDDGTVAMCNYCGAITIFEAGALREPEMAELWDLLHNPLIQVARNRVYASRGQSGAESA